MAEVISFSARAPLRQRLEVAWCLCVPYPAYRGSGAEGVLTLMDDELSLEFTAPSTSDRRRDTLKTRVGLEQVRSASIRKSVRGSTLRLKVTDLEPLEGLPGTRGGVATLRVPRTEDAEARRLVARLKERLHELEVEALEGELDGLERTDTTGT